MKVKEFQHIFLL